MKICMYYDLNTGKYTLVKDTSSENLNWQQVISQQDIRNHSQQIHLLFIFETRVSICCKRDNKGVRIYCCCCMYEIYLISAFKKYEIKDKKMIYKTKQKNCSFYSTYFFSIQKIFSFKSYKIGRVVGVISMSVFI